VVADWQWGEDYAPLHRCDRHAFAWEWLRRSPAYQEACGSSLSNDPGRFGLHRFEPVEHSTADARPIWRRSVDPAVLSATAYGCLEGVFDLRPLKELASCKSDEDGCEHWLLSEGWRQVRLDIVGGTLKAGPVDLHFHVRGLRLAEAQVRALTRLLALVRRGRFLVSQFPPETRAPRWAQVLRVHDALVAGASHREIAECLFGDIGPRWRITAPSWRRRVQRLAEAARMAASADPRTWLR